jgi:hypothetical protein
MVEPFSVFNIAYLSIEVESHEKVNSGRHYSIVLYPLKPEEEETQEMFHVELDF